MVETFLDLETIASANELLDARDAFDTAMFVEAVQREKWSMALFMITNYESVLTQNAV